MDAFDNLGGRTVVGNIDVLDDRRKLGNGGEGPGGGGLRDEGQKWSFPDEDIRVSLNADWKISNNHFGKNSFDDALEFTVIARVGGDYQSGFFKGKIISAR